ncbi:hypothetical protein CJO93_12175 [Ralstonia solanacearum]|nr:hypothetical protein CJO93_12175 [Ralstonia solanacearum]
MQVCSSSVVTANRLPRQSRTSILGRLLFSPSKDFRRNPIVYQTFIRYLRDDECYALIIPDGDRDWLG